jgi:hypothetical protein
VLAVGGIAVAPSVLAPLLSRRLSTATGADVHVGWINWNPFRGRVVFHRVAIAPKAGEPAVVTLRSIAVDVAVRRWLAGERALDALVLRGPWIALKRTGPGDFDLASLFPALTTETATSPATPSAEMGPPTPFRIGMLRIVSGSVEFRDETIVPVLETSLHLDDATAHDLVLATDGSAGLAFHVESRIENEPLTLDVSYATEAASSHLAATLVATNASLARALLYVPLGWQRTSGTMDATMTYERRFENHTLREHRLKATLVLHDLALTEPWATEPMLRAESVRVPALAVDFVKQRTDLGAIHVGEFRALVIRDADGMHVPLATGSAGPEPSTWQTTLDRVALGKGTAVLRHVLASAEPEMPVSISKGTIRLPPNEVDFSFAGTLAGGRLTLDGHAREASTALTFGLDDLALAEIPHLLGFPLPFANGRLSGTLVVGLGDGPPTMRGMLVSRDGSTAPSTEHPEEVLAWQALEVTIDESSLDPLRLQLSQATVTWPYVMLHRRADGVFPLTLGATATETAPSPAPATSDSSWLRLDRLTVRGGRVEYYDSTLPKAYGIDLTDLAAAGEGIALAPMRAEHVTITGAFDELSPLDLRGSIAPNATTLALHVDRLLLPPLNPYLAPALGYEVTSGLARIDSDVRLTGTTVTADTDLVLSRFAMRTAGEDTVERRIGAPLSVALALMKDTRGDIHLELPIEGDVAANQYRVGNLLREALGKALLGTLRAPLGFLRGMFGHDAGERFDLRPVPFAAGIAALGPEGEARLAEIARLLGRQTVLRVVLIPEPSRADLEALNAETGTRPLDALAELARARAGVVSKRLVGGHGVAAGRVTIEDWTPAEPRIEGESGVDVQLRAD